MRQIWSYNATSKSWETNVSDTIILLLLHPALATVFGYVGETLILIPLHVSSSIGVGMEIPIDAQPRKGQRLDGVTPPSL